MLSRANVRSRVGRRKAAGNHRAEQQGKVRVVLVNKTPNCLSHMLRYLEIRDCWYGVADTYEQAGNLICQKGCDLLVGPAPLPQGIVASLAGPLADDHASFFCAQAVEAGCWWLPVYLRGEFCLGMPALRPSEFAQMLDALVNEIRNAPARRQPSRQEETVLALAAR